MLVFYFAILPAINFLFLSTKEASALKDALIKPDFIPEDASIQDIVTGEMLITAWDLNNRSPRFFNKQTQKTEKKKEYDHDLTLAQMTWASANTPYYFKPAVIKDNVYISGDNMAISPALFSYYYANEKKGIPQGDIRIVSVGSTNELAEKIDTKASLLDWAVRLTSLSAPVKKHTMDYMVQHLLAMN
jgi:patatin-like phospholipase/acyl hydrolase